MKPILRPGEENNEVKIKTPLAEGEVDDEDKEVDDEDIEREKRDNKES